MPLYFPPRNVLNNPALSAGVVGAPGTIPACWRSNLANEGTITQEVIAITPRFQLKMSGIGGVSPAWTFTNDGGNGIWYYLAPGSTMVASAYLALVAGALTNVSAVRLNVDYYDNAFGYLDSVIGSDIKASLAASEAQFTITGTVPASTAFADYSIRVTFANTSAVDLTLQIYQPSMLQAQT